LKITASEEYGLRLMLLFARNVSLSPLTLTEVSSKEGLSIPYAGKLMATLKRAGLVKAVRGRNGGYVMARPAERIALKEIVTAMGESLYGPHHCKRYTRKHGCVHDEECSIRDIWTAFDQFIGQVLDKVTLADLASNNYRIFSGIEVMPQKRTVQ